MDETLIWCALILGIAYACEKMTPSYYDMFHRARRREVEDLRDDVYKTEEDISRIIPRLHEIEKKLGLASEKADD